MSRVKAGEHLILAKQCMERGEYQFAIGWLYHAIGDLIGADEPKASGYGAGIQSTHPTIEKSIVDAPVATSSVPTILPATLPGRTVFRITWPTGKGGLRESYDTARLEKTEWGPLYVVGDGHGPHGMAFTPEQVVWDEQELAACREKLRIAEDVR